MYDLLVILNVKKMGLFLIAKNRLEGVITEEGNFRFSMVPLFSLVYMHLNYNLRNSFKVKHLISQCIQVVRKGKKIGHL